MEIRYELIIYWSDEDQSFIVEVPELPGCAADGNTRKINRLTQSTGRTIWQRNYYEHIVRNEEALQRIRTYIQMNPQSWNCDQLHPNSRGLL